MTERPTAVAREVSSVIDNECVVLKVVGEGVAVVRMRILPGWRSRRDWRRVAEMLSARASPGARDAKVHGSMITVGSSLVVPT